MIIGISNDSLKNLNFYSRTYYTLERDLMDYSIKEDLTSDFSESELKILKDLENERKQHTAWQANFVSVIIKTTSSCNLSCKYCDADIYSHKKLEFRTLANIIIKTLDYAKVVDFIWHGGEPTLLGIPFYKKAINLQNRYKHEGQTIYNGIQTNGTLLNAQWIDFLSKNKFRIGISLDGPQILNDANRRFKNGSGSFNKIMSSIQLLKNAKMRFGALAVITEDTIKMQPKELLDFFIENGILSFGLNWQRPSFNIGKNDALPRDKYQDFIIQLFDEWYKLDNPSIQIREFDSIVHALLGGKNTFCILRGNCIGKYFGITVDGDVYHCDEFMFDENYKLGNINNDTLINIASDKNEKLKKLKLENTKNISGLKCEFIDICNGGCPKDRYTLNKEEGEVVCCGWKNIISHIQEKLYNDNKLQDTYVRNA